MKKKVLIVISDYYEEIGKNLLKGALAELEINKLKSVSYTHLPLPTILLV